MNNTRNFAVWVVIALLVFALFSAFNNASNRDTKRTITYSELIRDGEAGLIRDAVIEGEKITGKYTDGATFQSYIPQNIDAAEKLRQNNINITAQPAAEDPPFLISMLISWAPMLLIIALWIYLFRQMQSGTGKAMGFGKSKARLLNEKQGRVTFEDVAGVNEAKEELQEIVDFLKDPRKFQRLGGKIPKGALLVGPPGTGKTLLARAIAGEAEVPFFTISGSDFVEMFVGVGASRVRDMFEQAKKNAPCIVFVDEIDAVGRHRGAGLGGGNDEREQTLNQLLVEMDGFEANEGVILIAATNRPDVLDPALLRPGRFDRQIVVPRPDIIGREKILKVHMRNVPIAPDTEPKIIARGTPGFSGADLANLVNEAALLAARRSKRLVTQQEFEDAKDKVMMGAERKSMVMSEEEKKLTAYHEAGHALVSLNQPASDPIHKATIIPRGRALGMVMRLPERDVLSVTKEKLKADLVVAMGGRVAEEIIFGREKITSGASSDIKMATQMARAMTTQYGMSDALGPLAYGDNGEEVFLGHSITKTQNHSDDTQRTVDVEIHKFVDNAYKMATKIIKSKTKHLHIIAQGLIEYETLTGQEIQDLIKGKAPIRNIDDDGGKNTKTKSKEKSSLTVPSVGRKRKKNQNSSDPDLKPQTQS